MEQRSAEWHEMRKKYIGASDASALLGVSPWKNAHDVFLEKCGKDIVQATQNPYMQRGLDLEPEALRLFEKETGYLMSPIVLVSPKWQFMMASLDGFEIEGKVACEIKAPGQKDHSQAVYGQIPEKYIPQLQHQLAVTGLEKIYYVSYRPEDLVNPLYIQEVYRDEAYIINLIEVERRFYEDHMMTGIPPENPDKLKPMKSNRWDNLTEEYKKFDFIEKDAAKRKEEIKQEMIEEAGSENARGNGIILQKIEKKGNINYQNIQMLKTMNLEEYRKPPTSYWQVKESNETD